MDFGFSWFFEHILFLWTFWPKNESLWNLVWQNVRFSINFEVHLASNTLICKVYLISMILFFVKTNQFGFWVQLILIELMILTQNKQHSINNILGYITLVLARKPCHQIGCREVVRYEYFVGIIPVFSTFSNFKKNL